MLIRCAVRFTDVLQLRHGILLLLCLLHRIGSLRVWLVLDPHLLHAVAQHACVRCLVVTGETASCCEPRQNAKPARIDSYFIETLY